MPRVKRSVHARKKRRKLLAEAKGFSGQQRVSYRKAKEQVMKADVHAYRVPVSRGQPDVVYLAKRVRCGM